VYIVNTLCMGGEVRTQFAKSTVAGGACWSRGVYIINTINMKITRVLYQPINHVEHFNVVGKLMFELAYGRFQAFHPSLAASTPYPRHLGQQKRPRT